jgi:DegV family protein with EDD domain
MSGVHIVTDSSCDLTVDQADALGVEIVPLTIRFGSEELTDRVDLSVDEFYKRMADSGMLPETAAPSPGAFEAAFRRAQEAGATGVLCLNLSSDLSATIEAARNGCRALEGELDVRVVDSRSITLGLGGQVVAVAEAGAAGATLDELTAMAEDMATRTHVLGTLDTLDNLRKGGRIGNAQALLGNLLSIKPIIDVSTGRVEEAGKARTRRKALQAVADRVLAQPSVERLSVMHGNAPDLEDFLALLAPRYSREEISVGVIGAVIGSHAGARVIGACWQDPR